jgi:hypothetical protein
VFSNPLFGGLLVSLAGMVFYVAVGALLYTPVQALYRYNPDVYYAPSHYMDARQYVFICVYGYDVPHDILPTLERSRLNWMPVYAALQCGLHKVTGLSMVYTGSVISTLAIGLTLFMGTLTLANLRVRYPPLHALAALIPPIGGAWLYLPGAEATYLAVGMIAMWLITLPPFDRPSQPTPRGLRRELLRALAGAPIGLIFILTKPNALAMLLPLAFAFFYQSWLRSRAAGYASGLWTFVADVVIDHVPRAFLTRLLRGKASQPTAPTTVPTIVYDWAPASLAGGIVLGFAYWVAYSSLLSGIPNYFLQQQLTAWGRAWFGGNLGDMLLYFAQAFRGPNAAYPWRYNAAWNLAANLSVLIPASSRRVPGLIRGMLPLMIVLLFYSGAVHGSDRYVLSTAVAAVGWGCWLAPTGKKEVWSALRWTFLIVLAAVTFYLLVWCMFPVGEPQAWGILER